MHRNADGSVSFSPGEVSLLSEVLTLAEELTDQMEARADPESDNCEDRLLYAMNCLQENHGVSGETL